MMGERKSFENYNFKGTEQQVTGDRPSPLAPVDLSSACGVTCQ